MWENKFTQRKKRTKAKISRVKKYPRLSVFRSNTRIYAQIVDDRKGITLVSANEKELIRPDRKEVTPNKPKKTENTENKSSAFSESSIPSVLSKLDMASLVGELLAKKAVKSGVKKVVFDKGGYKYHGRVAALAQGARKGGLEF